ncbi:MAG: HAD family hydrolase [Candidatus Thiodiazotropha sp. LLP2]
MFEEKQALLLDMNSTFMFGEDRFGTEENFSEYYKSIGGRLAPDYINTIIHKVYEYLAEKYPTEEYRHRFPTLSQAIDACSKGRIVEPEKDKIIKTFTYHEHGEIPEHYLRALKRLRERFILSLVIDIWAPKEMWVKSFKKLEVWELFSAYSFSSDHGMVKPSPKPFEMVVDKLKLSKEQCLVIGDSVRRDLGGAQAAGIDCVLVGGAESNQSVGAYSSLLEFQEVVCPFECSI